MTRPITGQTVVAGVIGRPVRHSLSPILHNAWLAASNTDGIYVAFSPTADRLAAFVDGLRGGAVRGLNVTLPFKEQALALADQASDRACRAGAANVLLFGEDGQVMADNTDGLGLLAAFAAQAPAFLADAGPVVILGAGGAARGAAAAFVAAGASEVRLVNRSLGRAVAIADALSGTVKAFSMNEASAALSGAKALINATTLGLEGGEPLDLDLSNLPDEAVVMDMVYRPLHTPLLRRARAEGHAVVDGLEMLIRQAEPSFKAFFGRSVPAGVDVRALAQAALESGA
jgi:shikimate dehydrogenase